MIDIKRVKPLYGRLKGIQATLLGQTHCSSGVLANYNKIIESLSTELSEDLKDFIAPANFVYLSAGKEHLFKSERLLEKINEILAYLEHGHGIHTQVVEVGSLYNSISDQELKDRCADILSASSNFDRVINQATQVLEDRIRRLSSGDRTTVGVSLISAAFTADPTTSRLVLSQHKDEQEGIFHILRGIMLGFRNPTHHHLTSSVTREQALKVCGFIDFLLEVIGKSSINKP